MNKNAYEIRLDVLNLAVGIVSDEFNRQWSVWERHDCENLSNSSPAPKFPSTQDMLKKAEELYKFVERN
jgi:hypothetical protein